MSHANSATGNGAALSLISIPAVLRAKEEDGLSHAHAVQVWKHNYELGKAQNPPIALATAASFAFCAWATRGHGIQSSSTIGTSRMFLVAAAMTISIVPFTILAMRPINDRLLRVAAKERKEEASVVETTQIDQDLKRWVSLNGFRSLLPLGGAVVAGIAVLA